MAEQQPVPERLSDAPSFTQVGADHPVQYFFIAGGDGVVQGAMYLDLVNHLIGYLEKLPGSSAEWGAICVNSLRASNWDGRRAFAHWSDPANETVETYSVGPVREARNLAELEFVIREAYPQPG